MDLLDERFELRQVTDTEWVVLDHSCPPGDARRTVGCLHRVDEYECEAIWLRTLPLARWYASPDEAFADLKRATGSRRRAERPRPIAHLAPPRVRASA